MALKCPETCPPVCLGGWNRRSFQWLSLQVPCFFCLFQLNSKHIEFSGRMSGLLSLQSSIACFFFIVAAFLGFSNESPFLRVRDCLTAQHQRHNNTGTSPYYPSWNTWFDPSRWVPNKDSPIPESDGWNLYYRLGGYGPWIEKLDGPVQGHEPPAGCHVDQVHMVLPTFLFET